MIIFSKILFLGPHVNSEYYTQWFVYWGGLHSGSRSTSQIVDNLNYMYQKNASVNLYLVHGGDNFDFWNGAYSDGPVFKKTFVLEIFFRL